MENRHVPDFFKEFAKANNEMLTSEFPSSNRIVQYPIDLTVTLADNKLVGKIKVTLLKTNSAGTISFVPDKHIVPHLLDFYDMALDEIASSELQAGLAARVKIWQSGERRVMPSIDAIAEVLPVIYTAAQIYGKALKQEDLSPFRFNGRDMIKRLVAEHKQGTT